MRLDAVRGRALWVDLTGYHCYDGSFRRSLAVYATILAAARRPSVPWQCESSLDFLSSADCGADCISPTGFIFHAGRCGSTLLAKVLARSLEHMVFGEGGPHNQIWEVISGSSHPAPVLFRNLLLHTGRRRLPSHRAHIVKFTSFNVLQFETIQTAFPDVPALFLFRKPAQILASYRRKNPGWMGKVAHSAEAAVTNFFKAALGAGKNLLCLEYADLSPSTLPGVLDYFHLSPSPEDLALMRAEFRWDAKANHVWSTQPAAAPGLEFPVSQELYGLYQELSARKADFRPPSNIHDS